jgi:hypothetical protein
VPSTEPASDDPDQDAVGVTPVPPETAAVADRYRRLERPVSYAVALVAAAVGGGAVLLAPLVPGLLAAGVVLVALRVPLLYSVGTGTLSTDADPTAVRADFTGPTPPPLAIHWGMADAVEATADGGRFDVSYLFGLLSTTMTVESRTVADAVELVVTANGSPWATYEASIRERASDGRTVVDVAWRSDRRLGLRRVPQWLVARRFRDAAVGSRGYDVEAWSARLTPRGPAED